MVYGPKTIDTPLLRTNLVRLCHILVRLVKEGAISIQLLHSPSQLRHSTAGLLLMAVINFLVFLNMRRHSDYHAQGIINKYQFHCYTTTQTLVRKLWQVICHGTGVWVGGHSYQKNPVRRASSATAVIPLCILISMRL